MDMVVRVAGGYGRETSNFYNLMSCDFYEIDSEHCIPKKSADAKVQRKIIKLTQPLQI